VSEVEKWVRLSLIGGLNDEDTKQEVLSKVEELPLAETITFIEARETGKTATKILGGKMTSTLVNQVNEKFDDKNCSFCGKKGHGRKASFESRKANCPAYGQTCTKCKGRHHFQAACKSGGIKKNDDSKSDSKNSAANAHQVTLNRMKMTIRTGKISQVSQTTDETATKYEEIAP
jgi:hypothetical protein